MGLDKNANQTDKNLTAKTETKKSETVPATENKKNNKKIRWSIPDAIEIVTDTLTDSELIIKKTEKYNVAMERLQEYFTANEVQTWILCFVISRCFENSRGGTDLDDLATKIHCGIMKLVSWTCEIEKLKERGILENRDRDDWDGPVTCVKVADDVLNAVASNTPFVIEKEEAKDDYVSFTRKIANKYENRRSDDKSTFRLVRELSQIEESHKYLDFVKNTIRELEKREHRFFFYDMCDDFLAGSDTAMDRTISDLYDSSVRFSVAKAMMDETHPLFKKGLIEFVRKGNLRDATLTLTDKGKQLLLGEDADLFQQRLDDKLLIQPEKIVKKTLYYSEENNKQISRLREALNDDKLSAIQQRLKETGMPVGIAVILHGAPGTGKTESVYQIARETGRAIVHVDISDSKSCWFGESEKKIKEVFSRYKHMCEIAKKSSGKMPILLFNEADAIFAKRKDNSTGNVVQTENAIQNIILEEMENLQGILIATTNLASNLDPAFERRFLFKIKFENPSIEAKKSIWLDKLNWLSVESAEHFAASYELSGGQIDNIVRKIAMNEVITGQRPEISEIDDMCINEKLNRDENRKVGFSC